MEIKVQLGPIWNKSPEERDAALLEAVARILVDEILAGDAIGQKVERLVDAMLTEQVQAGVRQSVAAVVDRALDDEFVPQDKWGSRSPATSIRAEIRSEISMAAAQLSGSRADSYARSNSREFWAKLVGGHVKEIVKEEVGGAVADIRESAAQAVRLALAAEIGVNLKPSEQQ